MTTVGEDYLNGRGGSVEVYRAGLTQGLRLGQAFFSALSIKDRMRLRGTIHDPFYHTVNVSQKIEEAIVWLLDTEDN